jgi:hypothetical protein
MYFSGTLKVEVRSSEDVFDLLVADEDRIDIENQFRNMNRLFQLYLEDNLHKLIIQLNDWIITILTIIINYFIIN